MIKINVAFLHKSYKLGLLSKETKLNLLSTTIENEDNKIDTVLQLIKEHTEISVTESDIFQFQETHNIKNKDIAEKVFLYICYLTPNQITNPYIKWNNYNLIVTNLHMVNKEHISAIKEIKSLIYNP